MFASKDLFFSKPSGYQISRSVRFRASATAYFNRTPASATNRKTWTWSGWIKRGAFGSSQGIFTSTVGITDSTYFRVYFTNAEVICIEGYSTQWKLTTPVYRDPSAWYHVVLAVDTTQATGNNRLRLYVNGSEITAFSVNTAPTQNLDLAINLNQAHYINSIGVAAYQDGYLTEVNFIDGQQLTPSSFGQTNTITGVWQPIKYTGTYGTNGFYLNFSDNSNNTATTIGKDYSGNGNNWTPNNISVTAGATYDSMLDVPTLYADGGNGRGNYATLNPLPNLAPASLSITNGNLNWISTGGTECSTIGFSSGKYYAEVVLTSISANLSEVGITNDSTTSQIIVVGYRSNGTKDVDGGANNSAYGASYTTNDVIGIAVDADAKTVTFYKNNTSQGSISFTTSGTYFFLSVDRGANASAGYWNFGQRPFTYTPPTGYVALNTQNLPTPTISNGANYMAATTYTGTGSAINITNGGNNPAGITFKPDLVWGKVRNTTGNNLLFDSLRGTGTFLISNTTAADGTNAQTLTAFNSNGYSYGTDTTLNTNATTSVAWQWQAGAGTSSSNTNGSITSTVSVGATQGFSVVTYTGTGANATVGHGLGVAPKMVIVKGRSAATNWVVYNSNLTSATFYLSLNQTIAQTSAATVWNSTAPTSTVFSIGTDASVNTNTATYVAYCFSEVAGYSKFGSYTGNGSTDGPFVYCGFRPRWVLIKCSSTGGAGYEWELVDTSRNTSNVTNLVLYPNLSDAEATASTAILDITSNGFKLRGGANIINASSATYIFAVFAENPFKYSLAR